MGGLFVVRVRGGLVGVFIGGVLVGLGLIGCGVLSRRIPRRLVLVRCWGVLCWWVVLNGWSMWMLTVEQANVLVSAIDGARGYITLTSLGGMVHALGIDFLAQAEEAVEKFLLGFGKGEVEDWAFNLAEGLQECVGDAFLATCTRATRTAGLTFPQRRHTSECQPHSASLVLPLLTLRSGTLQ
jgi:hypothetical protein